MQVVKILYDENGEKIDSPKWCAINDFNDGQRTYCSGQVFGYGEGSAVFKVKDGKITCPQCIGQIKYFYNFYIKD